jgi:hypothetical protein
MGLPKQLIVMALVGVIGTSVLAEPPGQRHVGLNALLCQYDGHLGFLLDPDIPAIWTWGTYAPISFSDSGASVERLPVKEVADVFRLRAMNVEMSDGVPTDVEFVLRISDQGQFLRTEPEISNRLYGVGIKRALCERYQEGQG